MGGLFSRFLLAVLAVLPVAGAPAAAASEPVPLTTEARVAEVCKALQPVERQTFSGDLAARGQAKAAFEKEQERLKHTLFFLELPWGSFTVAEWDEAQKVVRLSTERPFRAFKGALALFDAGRDEIELEAVEGEIEPLRAGLAKGTLTLAISFRPAEEEGTACVISRAKAYAFAVDLIGVELRDKQKVLARAVGDGFQAMPSARGQPAVEIRSASGQECQDCTPEVVDSVQTGGAQILACYQAALARKPTLDGSLVLLVEEGKAGQLAATTVIADSLDDAELLACVRAAVAGTKGTAGKAGKAQVLVRPRSQVK